MRGGCAEAGDKMTWRGMAAEISILHLMLATVSDEVVTTPCKQALS